MACDCIEQINEQLPEAITIRIDFQLGDSIKKSIPIPTTKEEGGEGPPVYANYCPFCGEKWDG